MAKINKTEATIETVTNNEVVTEVVTESPKFNYGELLTTHKTKSGVIRFLNSQAMDCKSIYKFMTEAKVMNDAGTHPIRYQHVRNVLNTPIKKV